MTVTSGGRAAGRGSSASPLPPLDEEDRHADVPPIWLVLVVAAAGVLLRIWILASPFGGLDSDEAVVGLMARHFLQGEFTAFFWGSTYGGTLDQLLTAALFALIGPSVLALKLLQVGLMAGACVLTWRVGRSIIGEGQARVAALLLWVGPVFSLLYSTKSRGWYWLGLCLALTVMLLGLRLIREVSGSGVAALGFVGGLAWWTSPMVMFVAGPAVAYLVLRQPRVLRRAGVGALGFLLGSAAWIWHNLLNDFPSLQQAPAPAPSSYLGRLTGFFIEGLPKALGLRFPYEGSWLGGPAGIVLYGAALVGFIVLVVRNRRSLEPLLFVALAYPFLFAIPSATVYVGEPRYLLFLTPVLALLLAVGLTSRWRQVTGLTFALISSVAGLAVLTSWSERHPFEYALTSADLGPAIAVLDEHNVSAAWAGYWTSYRLTFETGEQVIVASLGQVRYRPYQAQVRQHPAPAFVLNANSEQDEALGSALAKEGVGFTRVPAGRFVVYLPDRSVDPAVVPDR